MSKVLCEYETVFRCIDNILRLAGKNCPDVIPEVRAIANAFLSPEETRSYFAGLRDSAKLDYPLAELIELVSQLDTDERRIMLVIAKRLTHGAKQYGVWRLSSDKRDWAKEAGEEMADALVYLAAGQLTKEASK